MSVHSMAAAYRLALPPSQKFLLLVIADQLDNDGFLRLSTLPEVATLTGYHPERLARLLSALKRRGLAVDGEDRDGQPALFFERISEPYLRGQALARRLAHPAGTPV